MDEFALIAEHFAPLARGAAGAFDLTDDAAVLAVADGCELVATKDLLVAGVHFLPDDEAALIARKLLRVNLSDLAAMGASPRAYLIGLAAPKATGEDWFRGFAAGLAEDQTRFGVQLIGGDLTATPGPLTASLTALGEAPAGAVLRRTGAVAGDDVYVSGTLGDAALGLAVLEDALAGLDAADRAHLVDRYRLPRPRLALGRRLVGVAHAACDVSDGLAADLGHICACSGVGAEIAAARAPLSAAARRALAAEPERIAAVLAGGDDYELVFAAPADAADAIAAAAADLDLPIARIGRCVEGGAVRILDAEGIPVELASGGYRHF